MNLAAALGFTLVVVGAGLALAQIWLAPWSYETFLKLIVTDGIVFALVASATSSCASEERRSGCMTTRR